jgi:hypothetical protein
MRKNVKQPDAQIFGMGYGQLFTLLTLYALAHGGIFLILNAIFWDDWTIYNASSSTILSIFTMDGSILAWIGHLHIALLAVGPWLYRVLTFILMFISGLLIWKIMERDEWIGLEERFSITLLFLVLPFNWARIALIDFPYILCYFAFFMAWYCMGKNRILALGFFLISFNTNSMLVFFALPIADSYFRDNKALDLNSILKWASRKLDFIALPFAYWIVKQVYYRPYGLYAGYNEHFSLRNLVMCPFSMALDSTRLQINAVLFICLIAFCLLVLKKPENSPNKSGSIYMLLAGTAALLFGVFPYCILGLTPTFFDWSSRHQLLFSLGVAVLLTYLLKYFSTESRRLALVIMVAGSIAISIQTYYELSLDWCKQREIMALIAQNDQIRKAQVVVFDDHTDNARQRVYRFYEWNALMKHALGDERRLGLNQRDLDKFTQGGLDAYFVDAFSADHFVRMPNQSSISVLIDYADESAKESTVRAVRGIQGKASYKLVVRTSPRS